jgi:acetyltransferase-like isoleucine patch superfamily enzyme
LFGLKSLYRDLQIAVDERNWKMPFGGLRLLYNFFVTNYLLPSLAHAVPSKLTPLVHRLRGVKLGKDVFIDRSVIIDEAYPQKIHIGNDVRIAAGTVLISHTKPGLHLREKYLPTRVAQVTIEDHCFIGINVVIMPGVKLGKGCVVVSGSVVMTNVKPYSVVGGNPAKTIKMLRSLHEAEPPQSKESS